MRLSNRVLGILILVGFILSFYLFYKYFFELKLTNLSIKSNVSNFSGSLISIKFKKDFFCENKDCVVTELPPFSYDLIIQKNNYNKYREKFNLGEIEKLNIYLEKDIVIEKTDLNVEDDEGYKVNDNLYSSIYNDNKYYYYHYKDKLYIYNKNISNIIEFNFRPDINYVKSIGNKNLLLVSELGTYNLNLNTKKLEYFSIFSDYIKHNNNYIGIINSSDKVRKKNFGFENLSGNLVVSYDIKTKRKYILENFSSEVHKIYNKSDRIYIENKAGEIFEIKGY